jgi:hypothetical protein
MVYETLNNVVTDTAGNGFTLLYTGTGTGTVALASDTITVARDNVNGLIIRYTGSGTSTVAKSTNDITFTRANVNAFNISYTPTAEETATITITAAKVTLTIDGTPTDYTFADADKNTITKLIAVLDAVSGITCTAATGAVGATNSNTIVAVTATNIKSTTYTAKYTPANEVLDVSQTANNTLTKLVSVIGALAGMTCSLATGASGASAGTTLKDFTSQAIQAAAYTALYTPADATWDTTQTANNTIDKLIALFNATDYLSATLSADADGMADSQLLVAFTTANMTTAAKQFTYISGGFEETTFMNMGPPIGVKGWESATFYIKVDINDSANVRLKFLAKMTKDGDAYPFNQDFVNKPVNSTVPATKDYIELDSDADQLAVVVIPNLYGAQYIQLQACAGTVGATPGQLDKVDVILWKR